MSLGLSGDADVGDQNIDEVDQAESRDHPGAEYVIGTQFAVELEEGEQAQSHATSSVDADADELASGLLVRWK